MSWIVSENGKDEHPPSPAAWGEAFTHSVLSALTANPSVWAKTVLFVMYDENDGWFDHVKPLTPPAGTKGEYITQKNLTADAEGIRGPIGLGFRVPLIVASPFSRGGHIATETFDHTSQLRFLQERFGVEIPNLSDWRRKAVGDLTSTLHMGHADVTVPSLPATSSDPVVVEQECNPVEEFQIAGGDNPMPSTPQRMPTQERRR